MLRYGNFVNFVSKIRYSVYNKKSDQERDNNILKRPRKAIKGRNKLRIECGNHFHFHYLYLNIECKIELMSKPCKVQILNAR
jgi:hypothetical protein